MDFDSQSSQYDNRAGLPKEIPEKIALELLGISGLSRPRVLELGAGTGQIGTEIARISSRYRAIERSEGMIEEFEKKIRDTRTVADILCWDANKRWHAIPGQFDLVFSSRALHLLDPAHVLNEVKRLSANQDISIVIGRVNKDNEGMPARVRRSMNKIMKRYGYEPKGLPGHRKDLMSGLEALGGSRIEPISMGIWQEWHAPLEMLASWKEKPGLGGWDLPQDLKDGILKELNSWMKDEFGNLNERHLSGFSYEISGIRYLNDPIKNQKRSDGNR